MLYIYAMRIHVNLILLLIAYFVNTIFKIFFRKYELNNKWYGVIIDRQDNGKDDAVAPLRITAR